MMMRLGYLGAAAIALTLSSCGNGEAKKETAKAEKQEQEITIPVEDRTIAPEYIPEESKIKWIGSKPTESHFGFIEVLIANVELKGNDIVAGEFVADMNTLSVTDMKSEEKNAKLLAHLKNEDFFSVNEYPEATILIAGSQSSDTLSVCNGMLGIKGIENPFESEYTVKRANGKINIKGRLVFDRTHYEIKYKSKTILGDVADKFINDEVELEYDLMFKDVQ